MTKTCKAILLIGCLVQISACTERVYKFDQYIFGSKIQIEFTSQSDEVEQIKSTIRQAFERFHHQWHAWEQGGLLSTINQNIAATQPTLVSTEVKSLIVDIQKLSKSTDDYFNPAMGKLIDGWGFHKHIIESNPPPQAVIQNHLTQNPSMADIVWQGHYLSSKNPYVQLDFGGVAKGYAADLISQILKQYQVTSAIINLGGDIKVLGQNGSDNWQIGIRNPKQEGQALLNFELCSDESAFTSGTYERFYQFKGQHYHHIINPKTGYPSNELISATVVDNSALRADVAATALIAAGAQWHKVIERMHIQSYVVIDQNLQIIKSDLWDHKTCGS